MPKIAADTNVLVRLVVKDDDGQVERARLLFLNGDDIVVMTTVFLEVEWVLRGLYRYDRAQVRDAFAELLALPSLFVPDEALVLRALEWHAAGMDFADALHLAGAADCEAFVTFDRDLARRAAAGPDAIPVRLP